MQKTVLTKAVAVALATLGVGAAFAQSSVTLYGNIDASVDSVHKSKGDISGTVFQTLPVIVGGANGAALAAGFNNAYANKSTVTRVSPSLSSQNAIGVKGVEDIGGGYKGNFVLEGQMSPDTGAQSGQDSRMWGRQAYAGLTTPFGEVRIGRQYAPMFYSYAFTTVEALGGADMQALGLATNNLQIRQDNQISYWLKDGGLTAIVSYSPQAGVDQKISSNRGQNTAAAANGQIVGGAAAGTEAAGSQGRGQTVGLLASYAVDAALQVNGAYHQNKYGNAQLVVGGTGTLLYSLDKATAVSLGTKYVVPGLGTVIGANLHQTRFTMDTMPTIKVSSLGLGVKHPIDNFAVGAQIGYTKFSGGTGGSDKVLMLIGDYNFSKRTKVYVRAGVLKDDRGDLAATETTGLNVAGGPVPLLGALGSTESPFFAGGGANIDATVRVVALGIRHQF
jgi:predicted porin